MAKLKIGIDLDITLFDTDAGWYEFLYRNCIDHDCASYRSDVLTDNVSYDLREYFTLPEGFDGFSYWSHPDTYKNCNVYKFAVDEIKDLYEMGCEIIFISYCMGCPDQIKYKMKRLKEEFDFLLPDDFNFIPTKKKGLVKCDILVDDRHSFLNQMSEDVHLVKWMSSYQQDEALDRHHEEFSNWKTLGSWLKSCKEFYYD